MTANLTVEETHISVPVGAVQDAACRESREGRLLRSIRLAKKTRKFDCRYARRVAAKLSSGEVRWDAVKRVKLFTDAEGKQWNITRMVPALQAAGWKITSAKEGDHVGCIVHQQKLSFVFSTDTLKRFGASNDRHMAGVLSSAIGPWTGKVIAPVSLQEASRMIQDDRKLVPEIQWTPKQRVWMRVASQLSPLIHKSMMVECSIHGMKMNSESRSVRLGSSAIADGWTDGKSYIAVAKEFFSDLPGCSAAGIGEVSDLILHEYCHRGDDIGRHMHDREFYKMFHDMHKCANMATAVVLRSLPIT